MEKAHVALLDSQIEIANRFYKKLSRIKSGREKIRILKGISKKKVKSTY